MRTIEQVLDKAKLAQNVQSDYKLALCLGIGESALANYRHGRSLPDEKACSKLAQAMGEDPAALTVEMQLRRAKTPEAKQIWIDIARRLQMGFANVHTLLLIAMLSIAACALPALAAIHFASFALSAVCILCKVAARHIGEFIGLQVKLCKAAFWAHANNLFVSSCKG